eukprot:scaffold267573_cov21-Tisochrysis_lutea.AAC.1
MQFSYELSLLLHRRANCAVCSGGKTVVCASYELSLLLHVTQTVLRAVAVQKRGNTATVCPSHQLSVLLHVVQIVVRAVAVQQRLVAHATTARPMDEWHKRFSRLRRPVDGSGPADEVLQVAADAAQVGGRNDLSQ